MSIIGSNNKSCITDAVYKFYVESETELTPHHEYYFGLYINEYVISFSNVFQKTQVDGRSLYEIDFFKYHPNTSRSCIPLNLIAHESKVVNIIGFAFPLDKQKMKLYSNFYYEKADMFDLEPSQMYELGVSYHESELTSDIRNTRGDCRSVRRYDKDGFYTDNVFRFLDGMFASGFVFPRHITDSLLHYLEVELAYSVLSSKGCAPTQACALSSSEPARDYLLVD